MEDFLSLSVGRRKSAIAKVAFVPGTGKLIINEKDAFHYLQQNALSMAIIQAPLKTVSFEKRYNIVVQVYGGGLQAQAEAIQLGIARALCSTASAKNTFRSPLKEKGFLRRDPRKKERKKYGLKKARKAEQYSKR
jgi:small subunit ribosomal protein S9